MRIWRWLVGMRRSEVEERVRREKELREQREKRLQEMARREHEIMTELEKADEERLAELRHRLRVYGGL